VETWQLFSWCGQLGWCALCAERGHATAWCKAVAVCLAAFKMGLGVTSPACGCRDLRILLSCWDYSTPLFGCSIQLAVLIASLATLSFELCLLLTGLDLRHAAVVHLSQCKSVCLNVFLSLWTCICYVHMLLGMLCFKGHCPSLPLLPNYMIATPQIGDSGHALAKTTAADNARVAGSSTSDSTYDCNMPASCARIPATKQQLVKLRWHTST
jgi:hypothetical protein